MGSEPSGNEMIVTQISVGGLDNKATADMLVDFFEDEIGMVSRCRLKTSSTPPGSYPNFEIDTHNIQRKDDYEKVEPHAFIHFVVARSATSALDKAGCGKLVFRGKPLRISLGPENPHHMSQRRRTTKPYKLPDVLVEIGVMRSREELLVGWRGPHKGVDFLVDPFNGRCKLQFSRDTAFSATGEAKPVVIGCDFRIEFMPREIIEIKQCKDFSSIIFLLQLSSAPLVYYRTADDDIRDPMPFDLLDDDDPWIRTTDFTPSGALGRCNTYRISVRPRNGKALQDALEYLRTRRVPVIHGSPRERLKVCDEPDFGQPMSDQFFCIQYREGISFKTLFLVNAVLHKGIINQHQMSEKFFDLLRSQTEEVNTAALKHICSYKRPVHDALRALSLVQRWLLSNPRLLEQPLKESSDIIEVRRLIVTPSKAYCLPPEVELSNRVLRHYKDVADRFLRVTFTDEAMLTLNKNVLTYYVGPMARGITSGSGPQRTAMFKRVKDVLTGGFHLCGRKYSFLAFSSNQLRDRSAWFFADHKSTGVADIKSWMGRFTNRVVAKCAARMGQCFSSTYATVNVPLTEVDTKIEDVENNNYPGFLNRQIVTLLSALEVKDNVFWEMQEKMVSGLDRILEDTDTAYDVLSGSCSDQGNTAAIMLSAGFRPQTEPHLRGMLTSIRTAQLGDLREKARIFVPSGRWLMGCLDESRVLEHGQCFVQVSTPCLENCFVGHGPEFSGYDRKMQVVRGLVAIAKNPCLHPGDVRILEAVDAPELHHLYDCLVFPQKGERPHPNEASGSDLDGDLYFVTWDQNLIPPSKRSWTPMEYAPGEEKKLPRDVKHSDIIEFFTKNMVNESLGAICNAHVVHADLSDYGALDEKCVKLAELAAIAVDFPKTGKMVIMPPELKPKMYPDFMGKEEFQTYKSTKILGKLYRKIKDTYDKGYESSSSDCAFDFENVTYDSALEIAGSANFIDDAWSRKCSYDGQLLGLLGQYKVNREEELVTGHIWSMPKYTSKKQGELKERLKHAYTNLRKEFRKIFETLGSEFDSLTDAEKNLMYEKKASAWYQVTYHERWLRKSKEMQMVDDGGKVVMLSFAWIAADYLARIKIRQRKMENGISSSKAIDSLGRYLADKI
ncbi:RNA-dependent RNA polymerase 6 [Striga asiatica]|uniref:RNA-dependent RNA polymerase n=1 Tax=Striga asiatica TaxID=4170 RepID=A0A5A7R4M3_STRAF|nr:RNA-dependent RNA polymerase 6 [Striga asiatica]